MPIPRIISAEETMDGMYVVVEFRHAVSDLDPYLKEDFIFQGYGQEEDVPMANDFGQVRLDQPGVPIYVWPRDVDGRKVKTKKRQRSRDEIHNFILEPILDFAERHGHRTKSALSPEAKIPARPFGAVKSPTSMKAIMDEICDIDIEATLETVRSKRYDPNPNSGR